MSGFKRDYSKLKYIVESRSDYSLTEALRHWKTKFEDFRHFKREVISESLSDFGDFVEELWESIEPLTTSEAFAEENIEKRRIMFSME